MFGFLRRKKPAQQDAAAVADSATTADVPAPDGAAAGVDAAAPPAVEPVAGAVAGIGQADAAPPDDDPQAPGADPQAPAARRSFWSRFLPGSRPQEGGSGATEGTADAAVRPSDEGSDGSAPGIEAGRQEAASPDRTSAMPEAPPLPPAGATPAAPTPAAPTPAAPTPAAPLPLVPTPVAPTPALPTPVSQATAAPRPVPQPAAAPPATPAELVPAPMPDRTPWLARLKQGLSRTSGNLAGLFIGVKVDEALFEELETALLTSDAGVETSQWLLDRLRERVKKERLAEPQQVKAALRALLVELLMPLEQPIDIDRATPLVVMIAGVNGAGKTTSIGKLARHLRNEGKTVLLAAGDTFRAAAREQLAQWGSRNEVEVISQQGGDPAAVAFDAVSAGRARATGVVMIDTAGRLPTQTHLMDELKKVRRVIGKAMDGAPHEVLLVLDGNTGQNMLAQVKAFDESVQLTGLIVTKLDGTARGGALAALAHTRRDRPVPVYFIGVGEGIDDLQAFSAEEFAAALVD